MNNHSDTRLENVKAKAAEVTQTMRNNVSQALSNSERVEYIEYEAQKLENEAQKFERGAQKLKCKYCKQHWKIILCLTISIAVIILIFALTLKH